MEKRPNASLEETEAIVDSHQAQIVVSVLSGEAERTAGGPLVILDEELSVSSEAIIAGEEERRAGKLVLLETVELIRDPKLL